MTPTSFFPETIWTVVEDSHVDPAAMETLCEMYRGPIYKFIHFRLRPEYQPFAEDLTQAFIVDFIQRETTRKADPTKGKFRNLITSAAENFLRNWHRDQTTLKKGSGVHPLSLDQASGVAISLCADTERSADELLDTEIALSLHSRSLAKIRVDWMKQNHGAPMEAFSEFLDVPGNSESFSRVGKQYGLSKDQVKRRIYLIRELHAIHFKNLVSHMVPDEELDAEVKYLSILRLKACG